MSRRYVSAKSPKPPMNQVLGADALRMRLRRLTETKTSGKRWVDDKTQQDYKAGGERRQWLEIALLESLKKHGTGREANSSKFVIRQPHDQLTMVWGVASFCTYCHRRNSLPEWWWSVSACSQRSTRSQGNGKPKRNSSLQESTRRFLFDFMYPYILYQFGDFYYSL